MKCMKMPRINAVSIVLLAGLLTLLLFAVRFPVLADEACPYTPCAGNSTCEAFSPGCWCAFDAFAAPDDPLPPEAKGHCKI